MKNLDTTAVRDGLVEVLELDPEVQRASIELYRQLAKGRPVPPEDVASKEQLESSAFSPVEYDEQGRVVAFGGLSLKPTSHRFEVGGQRLYTWCALDALFLPHVLGLPARIESTCPVSGRRIQLRVGPEGIESCKPDGALMSLVVPGSRLKGNVRSNLCCHVHFFATENAARAWSSEHEGSTLLPVSGASELAQDITQRLFKDTNRVGNRGEPWSESDL